MFLKVCLCALHAFFRHKSYSSLLIVASIYNCFFARTFINLYNDTLLSTASRYDTREFEKFARRRARNSANIAIETRDDEKSSLALTSILNEARSDNDVDR